LTLYKPSNLRLTDLSRALSSTESAYTLVTQALLVYTYLFSQAFNTAKRDGFHLSWSQMHSRHWQTIAGPQYGLLRDRLLAADLLEIRTVNEHTGEEVPGGTYRVAKNRAAGMAKQYRIPPRLFGAGTYFERVEQPAKKPLMKKLEALGRPLVAVELDHYREHVAARMRQLVLVDTPAARAAIAALWTNDGLPADAAAFVRLFNEKPLKNVIMDPFGHRVHADVVNFKKSLFPFVRYADDLEAPLEEIDLVNSQPAIFAVMTPALIRQLVPECAAAAPLFAAAQAAPDFVAYRTLCTNGTIYEHLVANWNKRWPAASIARDQAKEAYFQAAYGDYAYLSRLGVDGLVATLQGISVQELATRAGRRRQAHLEDQLFSARAYALFQAEFPALMALNAAIKGLDWQTPGADGQPALNPSKKGAYTNNCLLAQRFESTLVYGHLVKTLVTNGISDVWTRHDALVVKAADAEQARGLVLAALAALGLDLRLKAKP
jgi:hypothetical protein